MQKNFFVKQTMLFFTEDTKEEKEFLSEEYEILSNILKQQNQNCEKILEETMSNVKYEQYSVGSTEHRGYYCPSIIRDIVIGNITRGKLSKLNKPEGYTYGFDKDKKLILTKLQTEVQTECYECIFHSGNSEIGIGMEYNCDSELQITYISLCRFVDGKLDMYLYGRNENFENIGITEISKEKYCYFEDKLVVDWYSKSIYPKTKFCKKTLFCSNEKFTFTIKNGCLYSYETQQFDVKGYLKPNAQKRVFKVNKKRNLYEKSIAEQVFYLKE